MHKPRPAKVTRPRLHHAIPRHHLFRDLDRACNGNAVWLTAPPGAGKTTGVAGYLEHRGRAGIWYQVDAGDEDPATFFHYLRIAAEHGTRPSEAARLPLFTAEFLWDLPGFARRFFRQLFEILGDEDALVLDNAQEISSACVVHQALVEAIDALREGQTILVVSRETTPGCYARQIANERLVPVSADSVRYAVEESIQIVQGRFPDVSADDARSLHERSGGWAAGLTLLLEQVGRGERVADVFRPDNLQSVFDYFASQVYARASDQDQRTLLELCWLPRISSVTLEEMVPGANAARLLDGLYRNHLFTHRRSLHDELSPGFQEAGRGYVYQFHALFQAFLRERARTTLPLKAVLDSRRRSARALEALADFEAAFDLYAEGEDWDRAEALITTRAAGLLAAGRWKTVLTWVGLMPASRVADSPGLLLWKGLAVSAATPVDARSILGDAYEAADRLRDSRTCLFAAAAMVDTYLLEYTNFLGIDAWLDRVVVPLESADRPREDGDTETWLHAAALNGMTFRRSAHPFRGQCVARLMALVPAVRDANVGMGAVGALLLHASLTGRVLLARQIEPLVEPLQSRPDLRPHVVAVTQFALAFCYHIDHLRDRTRIRRCLGVLDRIATEDGLSYVQCFSDMMGYMLACHFGDMQASLDAVRLLDRHAASGRPFDVGGMHMGYAWHAVGARDTALALEHAVPLVDLWEKTGSLYHGIFSWIPIIWALRAADRAAEALEAFQQYCTLSIKTDMPVLDTARLAMETVFALDRGDDSGAERSLRSLMALVVDHGCMYAVWLVPEWFTLLMKEAIRRGIETQLAAAYLRKCTGWGFTPPSPDEEHWPWHIRVRTLGDFAVEREGVPVAFVGKAPRKALALLKCIITFGPKGAPLTSLAEVLWPDDDGDRAQGALRTALHRLRTLLGDTRTLVVSDGRASLDPTLVWVDLFAFERRAPRAAADRDDIDRLCDLYRGPFLPHDSDASWAIGARFRCQTRFEQAICAVTERHEQSGAWGPALACYDAALIREDMSEVFHRGRMRCLARLGRESDALAAYAQFRRALALRMGIAPSNETTALAESIRRGHAAPPE